MKTLLFVLIATAIFIISGCIGIEQMATDVTQSKQCPISCDDGDKCTYDFCSNQTNYQCQYRNEYNGKICDDMHDCQDGICTLVTEDKCFKIEKFFDRQRCYTNYAYIDYSIKTNNLSICNMLSGSDSAITYLIGDNNNSYSTTPKIACYTALALNNNDIEICDKLGIKYEDCYIAMAVNTQDDDLCNATVKNNFCYYQVAYKTKNVMICNKINTEERTYTKEDCFKLMFYMFNPNFTLEQCDIFSKTLQPFLGYTDICYYNVALSTLNLSLCDKIQVDTERREGCKTVIQHTLETE